MRNKRGDLKVNAFIFIILTILLSGFSLAVFAFPDASSPNTVLNVSTCNSEINKGVSGTFTSACTTTNLNLNDGVVQAPTVSSASRYMGVNMSSFNSSITDCGLITNVQICYERWSSSASISTCSVNVDANGGISYTNVNSTCPGTTANPGTTCTDVTASETWACSNFFGASGTRAMASIEVMSTTGGGKTLSIDQLWFNVTYTNNIVPVIHNISLSKNLIKGGTQQIIYANTSSNGVNDSNGDPLTLYCSNTTSTPTVADNICSGTDASYPYDLTCSYNVKVADGNETVYCRVYDSMGYSVNSSNATYTIDSSPPSLSIISVAGDSSAPYFDKVNDGVTSANISGESGMSCRWSSSDVAYSSMVSSCSVDGIYAICNFTDVATQGSTTRYISCLDSLTNENNATNNLNVDFVLDYTAPTTSDSSNTNYQVPPYVVTITESDNVDSSLTILTYYCTDTVGTCTPTTLIDSGGTVSFTSANRGRNYLRYYSNDSAGNMQTTQNKTINVNRLPNLTSATDNATTIKGGSAVNVSTVSFDSDSGQQITLFVCSTPSATSAGCSATEYCNVSGTANLSCAFTSESDSATHSWYAFIFDELSEAATNNPLSGSYTTDSAGPVITIISPANTTFPSVNVSAEISTSENSIWASYSLDGVANVSMTNISATSFTASLTNLAYGQHNITFYANDSYGNYGVSAVRYFTIETPVDVTAPVLTIVSPSNASYTNPSGTYINISSDESLSWAGYSLNGGTLTNLSNVSSTLWYVNLTSLSQETNYTLVVYGNDTSNNQGTKSLTFYSDSLAPRYSLVNASPNPTNVSVAVNCSIYWNDTYNINSVIISENSLGVYENHTISFSGNSGSASYLIIGNKLTSPGSYSCIFYASDVAGNLNSTSINFTVNDITSPTITPTSPTNGGVYNQLNVLFSFVSNENLSSGWYYINSTGTNITMGNTSPTNWNATFSGTNNNAYSIVFYGNDSSGNLGASSSIVFSINTGSADSIPPVISIDSIANASYKGLSGVVLNVSVNENVTWVNYSLNGSANVSLTNTSLLSWNATLSDLAQESTNNLIVYANDTSGNIGSKTIIFYGDSLAPRFVGSSATPNPANETQNVLCSSYVNDSFGFSSVKISENATLNGVFMNHTIDLTSAGYANYTILNVARGNYSCIFYSTDLAGNSNSSSTNFAVNDVTAPILTINSPINQNYSSSSVLFSLTTNEIVSSAKYSLNGGATNTSLSGSGVSWSKVSTVGDGSYTAIFYANDSYGNEGSSSVSFVVDTSVNDLVAPVITIWSPLNNSYDLDGSVLLNISSDEDLSWAGYSVNGASIQNLGNVSLRFWNATVSLTEGIKTIVFYANDSSTNSNQGNRSVTVNVDLNAPNVTSFVCDSSVNDSAGLSCNGTFYDLIGLDYAILSYNFSGSFVNSSNLSLSGTSDTLEHLFLEGNYTPGNYAVQLYLFDLAGRLNDSSTSYVQILDDTYPLLSGIVYSPNTTDELDPNVNVTINASVVEDYSISDVSVYYKNISDSLWSSIEMTNTSSSDYNVTIEFGAGNWTFYVNATDTQGNSNISQNYSFSVYDDISQNVTTNISSIESFTYSQRSSANELGYIILNTTSDTPLNYNVSISASSEILSRFNLNNTLNQTENYTASSGDVFNIPVYINLTGLTSGLYPFNLTVISEAGTELFQRDLNIQVADGPYLVVTITEYSSSVARGQSNIDFSASVQNLGTASAQNVYLNWSLPSGFSLVSGSLESGPSSLGVGASGVSSIVVNVSSSIAGSNATIYALASSSNADSANASKLITITNPLTVTEVITNVVPSGGGGGGGATSRAVQVVYSNEIEVVRGQEDKFDIIVQNNRNGTSLKNISLDLEGYLAQYLDVFPSIIDYIGPSSNGSFSVVVKAPTYKESYEEYNLTAYIKGQIVFNQTVSSYSEVQHVKLVIQEISYEVASDKLFDAEGALNEMKLESFNILIAQNLFDKAKLKLDARRNKESFDLSSQVIDIKILAFSVKKLINNLIIALDNPAKMSLITGNVPREIVFGDKTVYTKDYVSGKAVFASQDVKEIIDLANMAFERGDYSSALERAKEAQVLLVLERKGNLGLFFYLYWKHVLLSLIILIFVSIILIRVYKKKSISQRIEDLNKEEKTIEDLKKHAQKAYLSGRKSSQDYHAELTNYQKRIAIIKKYRINLRNSRIKLLKAPEVLKDLEIEAKQVESEIKRLQESFYKDKRIGQSEYETEFIMYSERLAEIEDERTTLGLMQEKDKYRGKYLEVKIR